MTLFAFDYLSVAVSSVRYTTLLIAMLTKQDPSDHFSVADSGVVYL